MPNHFLSVFFKFKDERPVPLDQVMAVFDQHSGDWMRWRATYWIVWTDKPAVEWYNLLSKFMTQDDHIFICRLDFSDWYGWAPANMWEWMQRPRD
jgi:hypothetical protein